MKTSKKQLQKFSTQRKKLASFLLYLNICVWLVIALLTIIEMLNANNTISTVFVAIFFLINILLLFSCGKLLEQKEKWVFIALLVILIFNTVLSFTGYPQILYILVTLIDIAILITIFSLRGYYLEK